MKDWERDALANANAGNGNGAILILAKQGMAIDVAKAHLLLLQKWDKIRKKSRLAEWERGVLELYDMGDMKQAIYQIMHCRSCGPKMAEEYLIDIRDRGNAYSILEVSGSKVETGDEPLEPAILFADAIQRLIELNNGVNYR